MSEFASISDFWNGLAATVIFILSPRALVHHSFSDDGSGGEGQVALCLCASVVNSLATTDWRKRQEEFP